MSRIDSLEHERQLAAMTVVRQSKIRLIGNRPRSLRMMEYTDGHIYDRIVCQARWAISRDFPRSRLTGGLQGSASLGRILAADLRVHCQVSPRGRALRLAVERVVLRKASLMIVPDAGAGGPSVGAALTEAWLRLAHLGPPGSPQSDNRSGPLVSTLVQPKELSGGGRKICWTILTATGTIHTFRMLPATSSSPRTHPQLG